jgi:endogenous inhibitor of DNA gyrase (YacG/DUF329 family)
MNRPAQKIRYGRNCPICGKAVELRLIAYGVPFRCQSCKAMLDISSLYTWLTHALASTLGFIVLWWLFHFGFWFAAVGALVLNLPLKAFIRAMTRPLVPLEPSDQVG